jgi:hypothetical protein
MGHVLRSIMKFEDYFFWAITPCSTVKKSAYVSEEHIASIFRVEE